jgi:hypothetical protein
MSRETGNSPEYGDDGLTPEERAQAEAFAEYFSDPSLPKEERREAREEVLQLEGLFEAFESEFSSEVLGAVSNLTTEEALSFPLRIAAKSRLNVIVKLLNDIENETNVTPQKFAELDARYRKISSAVGFVNNSTVRHP